MKLPRAQIRTPIINKDGTVDTVWAKWFNMISDSPMREVTDTDSSPTAPDMKKSEIIIFHCTHSSVNTSYLVYYDGTSRYYWTLDSKDLY